MKLLSTMFTALLMTNAASANEGPDNNNREVFECKFKVFPKNKKDAIKFRAYHLDDEEDLMSLERYFSIQLDGVTYSFSGALVRDDECSSVSGGPQGERCRMAVYFRVGQGEPSVAYANNSTKVGVIQPSAKFSCVSRLAREGETDIIESLN